MGKSKLTLVGAGPGDVELITLKGLKALQTADAVLYDALANPALLEQVRTGVPTVFVGKRKDHHTLSQDEINDLIIGLAFKYGNVVRLKGGDPFVFGRGYEEIEVARTHGIETEYIPGISSSNSVPGLSGIPVTHRGTTESFWVITATTSTGELSEDVRLAVDTKATVVILMGVGQLRNIATLYRQNGKGNLPIAIIQNGSLPEQKIALGTMDTIEQKVSEQNIEAPAVIVIGETVRLHPEFFAQSDSNAGQSDLSATNTAIDYHQILSNRLDDLKKSGSYRYFLDVNKSAQHFPKFYFEDYNGNKKQATNWCSNDYLCMSVNEEVISRLSFVAHRSGVGSGGTRNISGTTIYHRQLEQTLSALHQKEAALVFGGAYLANLTALNSLGKLLPGCVFISDARNHASIIEGIRTSGCEKKIFRHNDTAHLEEILKQLPLNAPKVVVFESVYSITGSLAPVKAILALTKKYNALSYVDEVHAVGMYDQRGGGIVASLGLHQEIDIVNGTLAKGFGVVGGYIAANKTIVDAIRSHGSGFIFTTSLPPAVCAAAVRSIEWLQEKPEVKVQFHQKVKQFRQILTKQGVSFLANESHITSVRIGDAASCKRIADVLLHEQGIYIQPVNHPTVPKGEECLRITVTLRHEEQDMISLAEKLHKVLQSNRVDLNEAAQPKSFSA